MNDKKDFELSHKELLSFKEAADYLNLSVHSLYAMTCKRKVPFFKLGRRIFFDRTELIEHIKKNRFKTDDELRAQARNYLIKIKNS